MALRGLFIKYNEISENSVSEIFTPLFVIKNSSAEIFLLNVRHCAIMVPCAGPRPGNSPSMHPEMLPAKVDLKNLLSIKMLLSSSCGGILDLLLILKIKLLMLNNPDNMANNPKLLPILLFNTSNPKIPDTKNSNILLYRVFFLLNRIKNIIMVINNK